MVRTKRRRKPRKPLGTMVIPDPLWQRIEPILKAFWPRKTTGRRPADWRLILIGIIFFACKPAASGTNSRAASAPRAPCTPGSSGGPRAASSRRSGWRSPPSATSYEASRGSGRRPTGRWARPASGDHVGPNPTDRGKGGTKRRLIVDEQGGPLGVVVAGANVKDHLLLEAAIEAIVVERPAPEAVEQHLCLDRGYDNEASHEVVEEHGYVGHIRPVGEDRRATERW
jgi:putative transposase